MTTFGPRESRLVYAMLTMMPQCHNERDCRRYLDEMLAEGLTLDQIEAFITHNHDDGL
jgi:hypothetical protein